MSAAGVFITAAAFIFAALPFGFSLIITVVHHVSETPLPPRDSALLRYLPSPWRSDVSAFAVSLLFLLICTTLSG